MIFRFFGCHVVEKRKLGQRTIGADDNPKEGGSEKAPNHTAGRQNKEEFEKAFSSCFEAGKFVFQKEGQA